MKKGFSLIALAVIVIVTLVLATSVVISTTSTINNSKKLAFSTEIKFVQDSISAYRARNNGEFPIKQVIIFNINDLVSDMSKIQFTKNNENIEDGKITLYEIDYEKCGISDLKYGNGLEGANDIYTVSTTTGKVYYNKGIKIGNTTYFTITDELQSILNMGWSEEEGKGIVFEPSTTAWTGSPVGMTIKIPKEYELLEISASTGENFFENVNLSSIDDTYKIYFKESSLEAQNYTISVSYKERQNSKEKISSYEVQNVDNQVPQITEVLVSHDTSSITLQVTAKDSDSGINKYYFSKDGINFYESYDNKYTFNNLTENTEYNNIYIKVEDKIGNVEKRQVVGDTRTDSLGDISIEGEFDGDSSAFIQITFPQTANTQRYYKIDSGEWNKVAGLTEELYIDEDCTIYAKIVDESGQIKEISKEVQKKE